MASENDLPPTIDDAVRELLRHELTGLGLVAPPAPKPRAAWSDVAWTVLALVNVALFAWTVHPQFLEDERFKVVSDVVPWVAGTFFAVTAAWFRERLIELISSPVFRRGNLVFFCALAVVQFPLIPLRIDYQPADASVRIGTFTVHRGAWVRLRTSKVHVVSPVPAIHDGAEFELSAIELLRQAVRPGAADYRWRATTPFAIKVAGVDTGAMITVTSHLHTAFTPAFSTPSEIVKGMITRSAPDSLTFQLNGDRLETEIAGEMPVGEYDIVVSRLGCTPLAVTRRVPFAVEGPLNALECKKK